MPSLLTPQEVLAPALAGSISRLGAIVSTFTLNVAAGVAEGLFLGPSGTAGQECALATSDALVKQGVGFSVLRPMSEDFDATHHYADNEAVAVMESGHMNVLCEQTCVANRPVFARTITDGAGNTVIGKVRADSDLPGGVLVITPVPVAAVITDYSITLSDGTTTETFIFTSDATPTAAEVAAGLVAKIDASVAFTATGASTISIGSATGIVDIIAIHPQLTVTTPARAQRIPNCFFDHSRTGAGLVELRLNKTN